MIVFIWNIFLVICWVALTEQLTVTNLMIGFLLSYIILWFIRPVVGRSHYFVKIHQVPSFLLFFLWEVILSSIRVAYYVLMPSYKMKPAVVAVPLDVKTDAQIICLANLITLTPGTLSLDVSEDRKILYVHAMFISDPALLRQEIKSGFERRILELFR